jgi:hypothetical protein
LRAAKSDFFIFLNFLGGIRKRRIAIAHRGPGGGQLLILDFAFWENPAWCGARSGTVGRWYQDPRFPRCRGCGVRSAAQASLRSMIEIAAGRRARPGRWSNSGRRDWPVRPTTMRLSRSSRPSRWSMVAPVAPAARLVGRLIKDAALGDTVERGCQPALRPQKVAAIARLVNV